jgi:hypothetical protein
MWSKLAEITQDKSYKRLAVALIVSILLHIFLLGGLNLSLSNFKKEMHVIEARIQMTKAVVKKVETPKPEEIVAPDPATVTPKEPLPKAKLEVPSEPVSEPIAEVPHNEVAEATPSPVPEPAPLSENSQPTLPEQEQPEDAGLVINENAYRFVETNFDLHTKINGSAEGKATITYNQIDANHYQLKWLTEGSGVVALFLPDLLQTSEGLLTKSGLQPLSYLYQFGNKADKNRTVNFDWQNKKVTLQTSKGIRTEDLSEGTQDLLSFMYQFMYVEPLHKMEIQIANGKKLVTYDYSFEGEEAISTSLGELKVIHIVHSGNDSDERTELWLALDYQYIPVKIRKIEKNGDVIEMVATRINTNRLTQN